MKNIILKILSLLLILVFVVVLFMHYHLLNYLSLDGFNHYHQQIQEFERDHVWEFALGYIISYILIIACCIPGTILFDLLAGFIYGPIVGTLLVLVGYLSGAVLNFLLVRHFFKETLHGRFFHLRNLILRDGGMRRTTYNLIALRFIPVIPFWLLNILAALLDIPFWIFVLTTFIGIIPTSIIYVLIGNGVQGQLNRNHELTAAVLADPKLWIPLFVLGALILIPNLVKLHRKKIIRPLKN